MISMMTKTNLWKLKNFNVIVDALFGIGLSRDVTGLHRQAIDVVNAVQAQVVSLDIPSGLCANDG